MIMARKVRLKPTKDQELKMFQAAGTARWAYNFTLKMQETNKKLGGKFISNNDIRKHITKMKKRKSYFWLSEVSNNVPKQAVKDACNAYQAWFKSLSGKSKLQVSKPKFKTRKRSKISFYNDTEKLKFKEKTVLIEKIGWMKTSELIPSGVKYTNPRVSFDGKYWYLSVGIEKKEPEGIKLKGSIGIDLGIKNLAVLSDGSVYKNINKSRVVKKLNKKLKRMQKQVSRKYEMNKIGKKFIKTENIKKLEQQIKLLHRKIKNIRENYIHQTTTKIVKTKPSKIVVETLNVKGMIKNKHLAKAISEQSFYKFQQILEYKCKFYGIKFIKANMFFASSKTCSCCGLINKKLKLSDRIYKCPSCHLKIDRDLNAAINLSFVN